MPEDDLFRGKIWKTSETLVFDGTVEDHDAGDFGMTKLHDWENDRSMFGEFLYDYMGKRIKVIVQILEPAPDAPKDAPEA